MWVIYMILLGLCIRFVELLGWWGLLWMWVVVARWWGLSFSGFGKNVEDGCRNE